MSGAGILHALGELDADFVAGAIGEIDAAVPDFFVECEDSDHASVQACYEKSPVCICVRRLGRSG